MFECLRGRQRQFVSRKGAKKQGEALRVCLIAAKSLK